jgi:hypothetical protein
MRLTTGMLAAVRGSDSAAFLTGWGMFVLTVCILLVGIATLVLAYRTGVFRRRIIYGMAASARLLDPSVARQDLHVLYRDEELADPRVTEIGLSYRGRRDIPKASFEGQPFCIDLGVRIVDLLETIFDPKEAPAPRVEAMGTALKVGPSLLRKGQAITFVVLTDGPALRLTRENPLADVEDRQEAPYQARQDISRARHQARVRSLRRVLGWAVVIFIAYYLFTEPAGAHSAIQGIFNLLNQAGSSLATFLTNL